MPTQNNVLTSVNVSTPVTMSSLELVEYINELREEGKPELRHDNFVAKIEKHPGIQSPKFLGDYKDSKGRTYKCYHLPKRECELMVMSESLEVQTKVLDRLIELEQCYRKPQPTQPIQNTQPLDPAAVFWDGMRVAGALDLPKHRAQVFAVDMVLDRTGVDYSKALEHAPAQIAARAVETAKEKPLHPALAQYLEKTVPDEDYESIQKLRYRFDLSETQIYTIFREGGLLESVNRQWKRTSKGCKVSKQFSTTPGSNEIRWDTNVVDLLIRGCISHYPVR